MNSSKIAARVLAAVLGISLVGPQAARADGGASTRNILFGAAAAGAGTLLIINHNKKVHEKYAQQEQRRAAAAAQANQAESAYESERAAYGHEAALVGEYKKEVAYQHRILEQQNRQIATLRHSLLVAKGNSGGTTATAQRTASQPAELALSPNVSYGWGTF
jgi:hypothetical protein